MGEYVQREKTFAALLPSELARLTGRKVELYNEGMGWGFSHSTTLRFKDALQAQPDLILWVLTHEDVARAPVVLPTADLDPNAGVSFSAKAWLRAHDIFAGKSIMDGVAGVFGHTRTALLLRHFLYRSQSQYVKSYLLGSNAGFLRTELDAGWKARLKEFDGDATEIEGRSKMAGVPFAAVFVPIHSQAAMVSAGAWPPGYDPYTLDNAMRAIIVSHGGTYLDILPDFRSIPDPGRYYMPVDGHPNAQGHAVYTVLIAKELASGAIPALRAAVQPQGAPERAK
jgi:hypothetical protein